MIALQDMHAFAVAQGEPQPFTCVDCAVRSIPADTKLRALYDAFQGAPECMRARALANPLAAARFIARELKLRKAGDGPAWGVVCFGNVETFAVRVASGTWWARSRKGVARVHARYVKQAWEIA